MICVANNTDRLYLKTGVRHGWLLSHMLFSCCTDCVMNRFTEKYQNIGLFRTFDKSLENLDFADHIALFAHRCRCIQEKTNDLVTYGDQTGLHVNFAKSKVMNRINSNLKKIATMDTSMKKKQRSI